MCQFALGCTYQHLGEDEGLLGNPGYLVQSASVVPIDFMLPFALGCRMLSRRKREDPQCVAERYCREKRDPINLYVKYIDDYIGE